MHNHQKPEPKPVTDPIIDNIRHAVRHDLSQERNSDGVSAQLLRAQSEMTYLLLVIHDKLCENQTKVEHAEVGQD